LGEKAANLPKASVVVVSQIATVDKNRLLEKIGTLSARKLEEVIEGYEMVISLTPF
jgi:mRNA interferase MazF